MTDLNDTGVTQVPSTAELAAAVARRDENGKGMAVIAAASAQDQRLVRLKAAAVVVDLALILCVSGLVYGGKISDAVGVPIIIAVAAGRLRPAMGSGALAWVPFAGWALDRWALRGGIH